MTEPGRDFLNGCTTKVRVTMRNVLVAVAQSPPNRVRGRRVLGGDEGRHGRLVRGPGGEYLARNGKTRCEQVTMAIEALQRVDARLLGTGTGCGGGATEVLRASHD